MDNPFEECVSEAFRLEARRQYIVEPEWTMYQQWLQNNNTRLLPPFDDWGDTVKSGRDRGVAFNRLRTFTLPMEPYVAFELHLYEFNTAPDIEEDVRLLPVDTDFQHQDFWLFDDNYALLLNYDTDGRFINMEPASQNRTAELVELKNELFTVAIPFRNSEYRPG